MNNKSPANNELKDHQIALRSRGPPRPVIDPTRGHTSRSSRSQGPAPVILLPTHNLPQPLVERPILENNHLANMAQVIALPGPEPFSGKSDENPTDFIARFEQYTDYNKLDDDQKLACFAYLLKGGARDWHDGLVDDQKDTYPHLKNNFGRII